MEEIKVKEENFQNFFNDDYEIADYFVDAIKNGEVKNFKYNVDNVDVNELKEGDYTFSFEMNNKKYVMDPEMSPEFAMEIIEEFKKTAFKFINKKPEKLYSLIERFKNDRYLKNLFNRCHFNMYDVETKIWTEDRNKGIYIAEFDLTNLTDDDFINNFYFTWYKDQNYCPDKPKSDYEIIEKNGGVKIVITYKDCDFDCCRIKDFDIYKYYKLKHLVEVEVERIRKIITETYFEEEEEKNEENS